jgi:hypothetical protein
MAEVLSNKERTERNSTCSASWVAWCVDSQEATMSNEKNPFEAQAKHTKSATMNRRGTGENPATNNG